MGVSNFYDKQDTRFDTRLSKSQKQLFEDAAAVGGYRNLSDFILRAAQEKADEIIREHNRIIASQKDSEIFFDAIFNPQAPNENLKKAAKKYNSSIEE